MSEEFFSQRRERLEIAIQDCVSVFELCYDVYHRNYHGRWENLSGQRSLDSVLNDQFLFTWEFETKRGLISVDVTLGHTGPEFQAFVTITTSDGFSERFLDDHQCMYFRTALVRELKRINGLS